MWIMYQCQYMYYESSCNIHAYEKLNICTATEDVGDIEANHEVVVPQTSKTRMPNV